MSDYHISVLLKETIENLNIEPGKKYIDATLGGGGHSFEILRHGGRVLGLDVDQDALDYVQKELRIKNQELRFDEKNLTLAKGNFRDIDKIASKTGFAKVAGAVFDLGVSSHQLQIAERGFSFQREGPLDMRMDRDLSVKAGDLINILTRGELYELFTKLGEEYNAHAISERIIRARRVSPILTTSELVEVVGDGRHNFKINPATKVFQALRIAINDEINSLKAGLSSMWGLTEKGGRLTVISFHSLEDRIVKNQFKDWEKEGTGKIITKKPIIPSLDEVSVNKRSRSSKLRVIEKL
ncbi:MAG TPA: 16S rRNA (cytosine(1402)-N(4))-methyltransferase RsmH [Xanthomonadales bacterium]|nr:16S rRNA (cytosine(1402)-N(4))-methyltransferase RsmH [Xanthomonadales bacterium]